MQLRLRMPLEDLRRRYNPRKVDQAVGSALSKTARKGRTALSRAARKRYMVKAADITRQVKLRQPSRSLESRVLTYSGSRISLMHFGAKEVRSAGGRSRVTRMSKGRAVSRSVRANKRQQKGVTVKVLRQGGRKLVRGKKGFGAFMGDQVGGGVAVFIRRGTDRLPLDKLYGPSIPEMVGHGSVSSVFGDTVRTEGPIEFERAMRFFLDD